MSENQATPTEHSSLVGGSTASRRINCPRSYALEKLAPPDKGSSYAREGTALHEMIAIVIGENKTPSELLPFTHKQAQKGAEEPWELTIDEDLWFELGQPALDAFDDFIDRIEIETGGEFTYEVEQRCAMPSIEGAFGTTDVVWSCGHLSGVWDWKFGRTPVSPDSDQLRFYGRAAASDVPAMFGGTKWGDIDPSRVVILSIMQPQCSDEPSHHECTVAELELFRLKLVEAIDEIATDGAEAHVEKGPWCNFARCKTMCPLYVNASLSFGEKIAKIRDAQTEQGCAELRGVVDETREIDMQDGDGQTFQGNPDFGDMLPELLELAEMSQDFAKAVFAQAHAWAEEVAPPAGWVLKHKRSSGRVFTVEEDEVKTFMRNRRYTLDDYMPRKMATMPAMEKILKKDGRVFPDEMYESKPSSGTTLTRDDGTTPSVVNASDRLAAVGNKLAALRRE